MDNKENQEVIENAQNPEVKDVKMTAKDHWVLAGIICSAIGTTIVSYFAGKK